MHTLSGKLGNATTLDEVIWQLDLIIAKSIESRNRLGYFAALYKIVSERVREGVLNNQFEDGARMERLDVCFANYYLNALNNFLSGKPISLSWQEAFNCTKKQKSIVLQHLIHGINVHINLDLGVAAAMICDKSEILSLENDFMEINKILTLLVNEVKSDMNLISPWIGLLDRIDLNASNAIINFSLVKARNYAWSFAQTLSNTAAGDWEMLINAKDREVLALGDMIAHPKNLLLKFGLWAIRLRESKNIVRNLELLNTDNLQTKTDVGFHLS